MDAFAVAVASGVAMGTVDLRQTVRLSWHFGLFQALMPILGWGAGSGLYPFIKGFDHWVAFALLVLIGLRMIIGALKNDSGHGTVKDPTRGGTMVLLSLATSIDALAVGLSISALHIRIWRPALIIGVVAFCFTALGLQLGRFAGSKCKLGKYAEITGGLVLIGIGLRILVEHTLS